MKALRALVVTLALASGAAAWAQAPAAEHPGGNQNAPAAPPSGVIADGKEYVYGAYLLVLTSFLFYSWSLYTRRPTEKQP
jgi:hypothetical protein